MFDELKKEFHEAKFPSSVILPKARFLDDASRHSSSFNDVSYLPFYYYLGKYFKAKNILNLGFGIGLESSAYMRGMNDPVDIFVAFREKKEGIHYTSRFGKANVLEHAKIGSFLFLDNMEDLVKELNKNKFDLVLLTEEISYDRCMVYLNLVWENLQDDGLIIIDHIVNCDDLNRGFFDFCSIKNREGITFNTRYGLGVLNRS